MIRACPHIRAMRLDGVQLHAGGRKERQHPGEGSGVGRAFPACKDFLLLAYNGGLGMFRWLHMTALASCPLTALPGFMVLNASGQHPEPWLYRLRIDGVQLHSGDSLQTLVIHRPGDRTKFTLS